MLFMETDELQEYLNALGRSDNYRVDAVLSDAPHERTERVFYVGNNGSELGPFIRKTIATDSGQGRTYEKIFRAQHEGKRFVHMPRIFECYVADSSLVVLLEYVEGETLQDYVRERGASYELALRIFPPICDAASELHKAFDPPLIHRDLTPANIVVSPGGITIIDLSIARTFQPDATKDTTYFGTRAYAPPEQFGFGQTDVRSDVYTLGKVLAFCAGASGQESTRETTAPEDRTCEGAAPTASPIDPRIAAIVAKATQLDPAQRYQSVADLKAAFSSAAELTAASESGETLPERAGSVLAAAQTTPPPPPPKGSPIVIGQQAQRSHARASGQTKAAANRSQPEDPVERANRRSAQSFLALINRIPRPLGIVWDVFVVLFWLLIFAAANAVIIEPPSEATQYPTWFLIVEYYGLVVLPCTIIGYFFLDLRMLRDRYPNLKLPTRRKALPFAIIIIFALVFAVVAIANYSGIVTPVS